MTTVAEQAIIDLQRQREAHLARAKNFEAGATQREPGDIKLTVDYVEALTRPVRLEMDFRDPIHTRQQIEVLMAALGTVDEDAIRARLAERKATRRRSKAFYRSIREKPEGLDEARDGSSW